MAINDYILCNQCGVKLLYDGAEEGSMSNREWYKERFGKDIEMTCPSCDKLDVVAESAYVVVNENGNYMRVNPKREPLSDYDVCEEYITTIKEEPWTRIKAYFAGVRFAEKYHEIGDSNGN